VAPLHKIKPSNITYLLKREADLAQKKSMTTRRKIRLAMKDTGLQPPHVNANHRHVPKIKTAALPYRFLHNNTSATAKFHYINEKTNAIPSGKMTRILTMQIHSRKNTIP